MNSNTADCAFCQIVAGKIPSFKIYEDADTLAFLDINPTNKGHVLVVPKEHVENIFGFSDELACRMAMTVRKIAVAVKNGTDADGVNINMNNEEAAGQEVFHAHIHIIPRFTNDGLKLWTGTPYPAGEAEILMEKVKAEIK